MQVLALFLIRGHDENLGTLPHALHLRSNILLTICEGVHPILEQESLILERVDSPFLVYKENE